MKKRVYINIKKDLPLLVRAFQNSEEEKKQGKLIQLLLDEKLALELNHMLAESHLLARSLGITSSHCGEINPGASQGLIHSLITKWSYQKVGLLDIWAELGCRLARSQYFRNGNKRTALLVLVDFINSCGFSLPDEKRKETFLAKWEKLLLDIAVIPDEELAQELLKERIFLDIRLAQIKLSYNTMTRKKYTELEKQILAQAKNQEKGSIDWKVGFAQVKENQAILEVARRLASK